MPLQSESLPSHMLRLRLSHLPNCYEAIMEEVSTKNCPIWIFLEQALEAENQAKHTKERAPEGAVGALPLQQATEIRSISSPSTIFVAQFHRGIAAVERRPSLAPANQSAA